MEDEEGPIQEQDFKENLDRFRVDIVQTLDLDRHYIFSYLRSNSILDEEDCEIIMNSGAGRKQKVAKFLDVLACKGPDGYEHFIASLEVEHPSLYEKMTGKRPQNRPKAVEALMKYSGALWTGGPAQKDVIDFDRQYLATQLEKTASELQMLSHFHNKIVHEKNSLEKQVLEAATNLEDQQQEVKDLREQLKSSRVQSLPNHGKSTDRSLTVQRYIQELMAENADKSNRIISLQQSLLDAVDNAEKDRVTFVDLQRRHEEVLQQLRDVTINYDWERRNSKKMSEKMRKQINQIKMGEDLRREIFELKLKLSEMQEQRDEARDELREFRNVTEALSAKFDTVRQEKDKAIEFQEECSSTVAELQQESHDLQAKLQEAYLDLNDLKRKNMRMSQETRTLREQRDVLLQEREITMNERNLSMKERDEAVRLNLELRQSRDESVEAHININKLLHEDYNRLHEEMDVIRQELRMTTEQNVRLNLMLREYENARNIAPFEDLGTVKEDESTTDDADNTDKVDAKDETDAATSDKENTGNAAETNSRFAFKPFPWKKSRSNTAVLNSAYRRINDAKQTDFSKHRASMPAVLDSCESSNLQTVMANLKTKSNVDDQKENREDSQTTKGKQNNNTLKIDVNAARALSRSSSPSSPHTQSDRSNRESAKMLTTIVPFISDLSMNFAMQSGSQENLNQKEKERAVSPMSEHLMTSDSRSKHARKSVSPKILYRVDQNPNAVFNLQKLFGKGKEADGAPKNSHNNDKDEVDRKEGRSTPVNAFFDGKTKSKESPAQANKSKKAVMKHGSSVETTSSFLDLLNVNIPKRRHSSADLISHSAENEISDV